MNTTTKTELQLTDILSLLDFIRVFAADKKEIRQYLQDIVVEENRIYAANGHCLGVVTLIDEYTTGLNKRVSVQSVVNSIKTKKDLLEISDYIKNYQNYPDINRLIPKTEVFERCGINTGYLATAFTALNKLQRKYVKFPATIVSSTSANNANVFEAKLVNKEEQHFANVKIIIMPMRL